MKRNTRSRDARERHDGRRGPRNIDRIFRGFGCRQACCLQEPQNRSSQDARLSTNALADSSGDVVFRQLLLRVGENQIRGSDLNQIA